MQGRVVEYRKSAYSSVLRRGDLSDSLALPAIPTGGERSLIYEDVWSMIKVAKTISRPFLQFPF